MEHLCKNEEFQIYCGAQEGGKALILYTVGFDAVAPLEEHYIRFVNVGAHAMITHLQDKTALRVSNQEKEAFKSKGYEKPWDTMIHVETYFKDLIEFRTRLTKRKINNTKEERTLVAVEKIQKTACFPSKVIMDWEKKSQSNKT